MTARRMSEPKRCTMLFATCKRGHPRTPETTFERKVRIVKNGKEYRYIARECRICHAMRNNRTPSWSKFQSRSKWAHLRQADC